MRKNHTESHFRHEKSQNNHIFRGKPFSPSGKNGNLFVDTADMDNTFSLKMNLRGQEGIGNMTVVFDKNPVKLNSWTVIDATGAKTDVAFYDLRTKTDFPSDYFQIQRHKTVSTSGGDSFYD